LIFKEKGLLALRQSQQSDKGWRVRVAMLLGSEGASMNGIFP
jgi:hypothetical protein